MKKLVFAAVAAFCLVAAPAANQAAAHDGAHDNANHARKKSARRAAKARRKRPAQAATVFTCSMHPEVRSKTAGSCPKCGMDLVAKRPGRK